ncbi:Uncharacterised protein [Kluyvera ascorbata]|nr:Uncharacterised protein [Kluyvera ascorbata]
MGGNSTFHAVYSGLVNKDLGRTIVWLCVPRLAATALLLFGKFHCNSPLILKVAIWAKKSGSLFDELSSDLVIGGHKYRVTFNPLQHRFWLNPLFQSGVPCFPCSLLRVSTTAIRVSDPRLFECRRIIMFIFLFRCVGASRCTKRFILCSNLLCSLLVIYCMNGCGIPRNCSWVFPTPACWFSTSLFAEFPHPWLWVSPHLLAELFRVIILPGAAG